MTRDMTIRTHLRGPRDYRLNPTPNLRILSAGMTRFRRLKSPLRAPYGLAFALCLALTLWALIAIGVIALR